GPVKKDLLDRGITKKPPLVAHSMGGAITNLALRKRPDIADRVAYIAPMFDINFGLAPRKPLQVLAEVLCYAGCGKLTMGRDPGEPRFNISTTDLARENWASE